jgi:hypothetical protein
MCYYFLDFTSLVFTFFFQASQFSLLGAGFFAGAVDDEATPGRDFTVVVSLIQHPIV